MLYNTPQIHITKQTDPPNLVGQRVQAILKSGDWLTGKFDDLGDPTGNREYIKIGDWTVREADIIAWRVTS